MKFNTQYIDLIEGKIEGAYKFPYFLICHRIPQRTFKIKGHHFPVCARCTGIYISAACFFAFVILTRPYLDLSYVLLGILLIIPMLVDDISQLIGLRESNNMLRFLTGLLGGPALIILSSFIKFIIFT
ncbi:DUF2085 domain-containing protein [Methanobrevibacter curvatus]|uniref:DUF2085 domain-containing protein n=1 Tax=Methanobrevibacter curvatus TaxID=49547 RepID=A0A166CHQ2_9EURY|nr:DUF2085 domain-containing protein [Methanobrevibacter curvatus]KZX14457.1 hypothetical protein MBCUR_04630 [Methanobrevibacter curvatus]